MKGKQGYVITCPSERSNILPSQKDNASTKITEKYMKEEVIRRKLGYDDLGYVVLLSSNSDRSKPNPGTIYGGFFSKKQFFAYPVTKQLKVGAS